MPIGFWQRTRVSSGPFPAPRENPVRARKMVGIISFVSQARFKSMVKGRLFLEWAQVHRNFYGTPAHWVAEQRTKGKDVLFVIDVQGGKAIKKQSPEALLIFVKPPSMAVLKQRLLGRKSESTEALRVRLADAKWEMKEGKHYDRQVVNDRLSKAVSDVHKIVRDGRKRAAIPGNGKKAQNHL